MTLSCYCCPQMYRFRLCFSAGTDGLSESYIFLISLSKLIVLLWLLCYSLGRLLRHKELFYVFFSLDELPTEMDGGAIGLHSRDIKIDMFIACMYNGKQPAWCADLLYTKQGKTYLFFCWNSISSTAILITVVILINKSMYFLCPTV